MLRALFRMGVSILEKHFDTTEEHVCNKCFFSNVLDKAGNKCVWENMDIDYPGLKNDSAGVGKIYKVSLENLAVPENKEVLKKKKKEQDTIMGVCQRDNQSQLKISQ